MAEESHLMMSATADTADDDDLSTSSGNSLSSSSLDGSLSSASEEAEFVAATPHEDDDDDEVDDDDAMEVVPDNDENDDSDEELTPPPAPEPAPSRSSSMTGSTKMRIKLRMSLTPKTKTSKGPSLPLNKKAQNRPILPTKKKKKKRPRSDDDQASSQLRNSSSSSGPVASVVCSTAAVDATAVVHSSSDEEEFDEAVTEAAVVPSSSTSTNKKKTTSSKPQSKSDASAPSKKSKAGSALATDPSPAPSSTSVTSRSAVSSSQPSHAYHTRPVRIPPISSPGLLIPSGSTSSGGASAGGGGQGGSNGTSGDFVTPTSVFDRAMSLAGYTAEGRTSYPHRGSSVKRIVGDMFDSDVFMTLHFPELVPDDLLGPPRRRVKKSEGSDKDSKTNNEDVVIGKTPLPSILTDAISLFTKKQRQDGSNEHKVATGSVTNGRRPQSLKRKAPLQFIDMVPKSLTASYPESFTAKRIKYIQQVSAREAAIVASQNAADAAEDANELYEEAKEEWAVKVAAYKSARKDAESNGKNGKNDDDDDDGGPPPMPVPPPIPAPVHVPPIPTPPTLPSGVGGRVNRIKSESNGADDDASEAEGRQSMDTEISEEEKKLSAPDNGSSSKVDKESFLLDIPKDKKHLVSHLDPACFHVTNGRYVGLMCNSIADPQFVGPNAPGITGLNVSGGTGLATSYVGSSGGGGGGSSHSSSYYAGVSGVLSNQGSGGAGGGASGKGSDGASKKKSSSSSKSGGGAGGSATATSHELKRIMEQGGEEAERIRTSIIRAAVYASRSGNHGGTFVGANGETYPDVSKAFSMHGNMRPCNRCKSNKQGAYHCRLRRKHKEPDYDGGDSAAVLAPFFDEPLEDLLVTPASMANNSKKT